MAQQTQKQQEQQRGHELHIQRQREADVQLDQKWEQRQQHLRRDIYGIEPHVAYSHQRPPLAQPGALPHLHPSNRPGHYRTLSRGEERR
jgi:hypothetical protein